MLADTSQAKRLQKEAHIPVSIFYGCGFVCNYSLTTHYKKTTKLDIVNIFYKYIVKM